MILHVGLYVSTDNKLCDLSINCLPRHTHNNSASLVKPPSPTHYLWDDAETSICVQVTYMRSWEYMKVQRASAAASKGGGMLVGLKLGPELKIWFSLNSVDLSLP